MQSDQAVAAAFTALAHPRRVRLFRLLVEHPELGRSVKQLQRATGYKDAPLLHHLRVLERSGLILRRRTGSTVAHVLKPGSLTAAMRDVDRLTGAAGAQIVAAVS
jgi:DNA-binding transcriptional ArsR family regulator